IKIDPFFYLDFARHRAPRHRPHRNQRVRAKVEAHIRECLKEFPVICEGVLMLNGFEHWFTYMVRKDCVEVQLAPRDLAEDALNTIGLSTHEPGSPLPGSEVKH